MNRKNKKINSVFLKERGFTLIELLVVISIIGLLSTIVLASLNDARIKAKNSAKNSTMLEYVKALELYASDNDLNYPISGDADSFPVCMGYSSTESCYGSSFITGSLSINGSLTNYLPEDFADKTSIISGTRDYRGITYKSSDGETYVMRWILEKQISNCPNNTTSASIGIHRACTYTLN